MTNNIMNGIKQKHAVSFFALLLTSYQAYDLKAEESKEKSSKMCQSIINRFKEPASKTCQKILQTNEVSKHIGELATVEFLVDHTHECHKGLVYLNESKDYKTCIAAVIDVENRKAFPNNTNKEYSGKKIRVTGKIEIYGGTPKIVLDSPKNLLVLQTK